MMSTPTFTPAPTGDFATALRAFRSGYGFDAERVYRDEELGVVAEGKNRRGETLFANAEGLLFDTEGFVNKIAPGF